MARPWYPRYPDDYARKTAHLTFEEHGAYGLLMDQYYRTGEPLPADEKALARVTRASTKSELRAIVSVLTQFFERRNERLHNPRADEEIAWANELSLKRSCARKQRSNAPTIDPQKTTQLQPQLQLQEDSTTEPGLEFVGSASAKPKKGTRWESTRIVEYDWLLDAKYAREKRGLQAIDLELEADKFKLFWSSKSGANATKMDWHAAFIVWCLKAEGNRSNGMGSRTGTLDRLATLKREALDAEHAEEIREVGRG